jgi:hypothetical protein
VEVKEVVTKVAKEEVAKEELEKVAKKFVENLLLEVREEIVADKFKDFSDKLIRGNKDAESKEATQHLSSAKFEPETTFSPLPNREPKLEVATGKRSEKTVTDKFKALSVALIKNSNEVTPKALTEGLVSASPEAKLERTSSLPTPSKITTKISRASSLTVEKSAWSTTEGRQIEISSPAAGVKLRSEMVFLEEQKQSVIPRSINLEEARLHPKDEVAKSHKGR